MKHCTIEILDEVNVKIKNLDPSTRRRLQKKLQIFNPTAKFSPMYKMGRWNGYLNFFNVASGSTYFYLLEKILPVLQEEEYIINWVDYRKEFSFSFDELTEEKIESLHLVWPENHPNAGQKISLRYYQIEAINDFLRNFHGIKEIPTGSGKTLITALLAKCIEEKTNGNTITIVPSKSLVLQTEEDFKMLKLNVGVFYGDRKNIDCKHIISTWQSLESVQKAVKKQNPKDDFLKELGKHLTAVIVDECHSAKANILKNILTGPFSFIPLRFGITATIPKFEHEKIPLIISLGNIIDKIEIKKLQNEGYLAHCNVNILQIKIDKVFSDYIEENKYLAGDDEYMQKLAATITSKILPDGNTLILINRIQSGEKLMRLIPNAKFLSGKDNTETRKKIYDEFAIANNVVLIATYGICSIGINIPRIFNLVMIEPGKSFIKVIQTIGRGLRKTKDKYSVNIYDISATSKYSRRHLNDRIKYYNDVNFPVNKEKIDF